MGLSRTSTPLWIKSYECTSNGSLPPMRTSCPPWTFAGVMGGGPGGVVRLHQVLLCVETTGQNDHRKRVIKYLSETDLSIIELHLHYEFKISHSKLHNLVSEFPILHQPTPTYNEIPDD